MKTILLMALLISCGKNVNHSKRDLHHLSQLMEAAETKGIPRDLSFKAFDHRLTFKSAKVPTHDFFEATKDINRFFAHELSHIDPASIYQLETTLPEYIELYLHDQNKEILVDPHNFKIDYNILDRLSSKKSYLAIHIKKEAITRAPIIIKNYQRNEINITSESIENYLKKNNIEASLLSIEGLLNMKGDNHPRWWLQRDTPKKYKLLHSSLNELKEYFHQAYLLQKKSLKRVNGKGATLTLNDSVFIKISAHKTLQKQTVHHVNKTYYTQMGELPYACFFKEAKAQQEQKLLLSNEEIRRELGTKKYVGTWDYNFSPSLNFRLADLTSGFFNIGIISRKCKGDMGPKVSVTRLNQEKELELLIESYVRRE